MNILKTNGFPSRGVSLQTVAVLAVGMLASLGLIGIFIAYIYAPKDRDVLVMAGGVLGFIATITTGIFAFTRSDDAAVKAEAAVVQAQTATIVSQETKADVAVVKESVDVVHSVVNSKMDALGEARERQGEANATLIGQEREALQAEATRVATAAATDAARAATLEATRVATEAMREMVTMAVAAAMQATPPSAHSTPSVGIAIGPTDANTGVEQTIKTVEAATDAAKVVLDEAKARKAEGE